MEIWVNNQFTCANEDSEHSAPCTEQLSVGLSICLRIKSLDVVGIGLPPLKEALRGLQSKKRK